jgi:hypothetical protein
MLMRAGKTSIPHLGVLLRFACIFAVLLSAGCGDRGGGYIIEPSASVRDTTPPTVLSTSPSVSATGIPINTTISVTFSEYVSSATVTNVTFSLKDNADQGVSAMVNCNGSSITLTPDSWLSINTPYTVTVSTGIADLNGNYLASTFQWTFTTNSQSDLTPPTITAMSPANAQNDVALSTAITVTFSESIMSSTITPSTVTLTDMANDAFDVGFSLSGNILVITPTNVLKIRSTYRVCVTTGVSDLAGNTFIRPVLDLLNGSKLAILNHT